MSDRRLPAIEPGTAGAEALPLEPSPESFRELVNLAVERLIAHLATLPEQPSAGLEGAEEVARSLRESELPEQGTPLADLLDLLFERAVPKSYNTAGPGYLAYIPGGGLPTSALADFLASGFNRYVGVWQAAPALAELEANVLRWLAGIIGYPAGARGFLTSGGSLANFGAVVTARRERLPEDFLAGTLYASDQVHHSVTKAATLAGFPAANVRLVASDERFRLRLDALEEAIAEDRRAGRKPFLVVASAGTTNTGAVDPLAELAGLARHHELWLHVDAAYGGFFVLTGEGRRKLAGLEEADSVVLDPHKGLFLPYGSGSLLVRDGKALERAHSVDAAYLPARPGSEEFWDFSVLSPELSRPFRGLSAWLPLRLHGAAAFRAALEEKLALARQAAARLGALPHLEIVAAPELSLFPFRLRPPGVEGEDLDRLNRELLARVNGRRRVYLTGTTTKGAFLPRVCVLSFRTHAERIDALVEDVRMAARELTG